MRSRPSPDHRQKANSTRPGEQKTCTVLTDLHQPRGLVIEVIAPNPACVPGRNALALTFQNVCAVIGVCHVALSPDQGQIVPIPGVEQHGVDIRFEQHRNLALRR
jgi:hypothetical protein